MKNTQWFILTFIGLILYSCSDPEYSSEIYIKNHSDQTIKISVYRLGLVQDSMFFDIGDYSKEQHYGRGGAKTPPPFGGDSAIISYNDTTSIAHYRIEGQGLLQNIYYTESWKTSQIGDYKRVYEYIITDADYEEALIRDH